MKREEVDEAALRVDGGGGGGVSVFFIIAGGGGEMEFT